MRLWSVNFIGHYPVGTAAVIVAVDLDMAYDLACGMLRSEGLWEANNSFIDNTKFTKDNLAELDMSQPQIYMLNNGDY